MSGSTQEVQKYADAILELLGCSIRAGELVIRFSDGVVQRCETRTVHETQRAMRQPAIERRDGNLLDRRNS